VKITQLNSASVIIEDTSTKTPVKILCDPWLIGEAYIGSWTIYPHYNFIPKNFLDIDYIYVSHIHDDHNSTKTLSQLDKNIPVLIHNFPDNFLKNKIERLGFKTIKLEHGIRTKLKENMFINILAADNCNPRICGQIMGCGLAETKYQTTQIDTMAVFDNGNQVVVNTNDCPFDVAETIANNIKSTYEKIDGLLLGYVAASSWPHCYNLSREDKKEQAVKKQFTKLETSKKYIELFQPRFYIPFAGRYTLCGKNTVLNQYRGEPELEDAFEWLVSNVTQKYTGVILNNDCWIDIDTGKTNKKYIPIDKLQKKKYIEEVLAYKKFPYEYDSMDIILKIEELIPKAYENFEKIRKKIGWISDTLIIIKTANEDNKILTIAISCNGKGYNKISNIDIQKYKNYMMISLDIRLLLWLLTGPLKALWSNADLGAHLKYDRVVTVYKRGLFYCWNHFYAAT